MVANALLLLKPSKNSRRPWRLLDQRVFCMCAHQEEGRKQGTQQANARNCGASMGPKLSEASTAARKRPHTTAVWRKGLTKETANSSGPSRRLQ